MKTHNFKDYIKPNTEFSRILKYLPKPEKDGPWIAGGSLVKSIENNPLDKSDIDFFFKDRIQLELYRRIIKSIPYIDFIVSEKENDFTQTFGFHIYEKGYNKTVPVQFIHFKHWNSMEELLNDFDFTVCQFGFDGEILYSGDDSFDDLRKKEISFCRVNNSTSTIKHVQKYLDGGFTIAPYHQQYFEELKGISKKDKKKYYGNEDDERPITLNDGIVMGQYNILPTVNQWNRIVTGRN